MNNATIITNIIFTILLIIAILVFGPQMFIALGASAATAKTLSILLAIFVGWGFVQIAITLFIAFVIFICSLITALALSATGEI